VTISAPKAAGESGPLRGVSFVFTGKLEKMDRKVAQEEVRKLGADTPASVGPKLNYLVIGVERDGQKSTKEKAAEKYNGQGSTIGILDESKFLEFLEAARQGRVPVTPARASEGG